MENGETDADLNPGKDQGPGREGGRDLAKGGDPGHTIDTRCHMTDTQEDLTTGHLDLMTENREHKIDNLGQVTGPQAHMRDTQGPMTAPPGHLKEVQGQMRDTLGQITAPRGQMIDTQVLMTDPSGRMKVAQGHVRDTQGLMKEQSQKRN